MGGRSRLPGEGCRFQQSQREQRSRQEGLDQRHPVQRGQAMICKFKTLSPFWGRPCPNFGDSSPYPCPNFGDGLSPFWGRIGLFWTPPCPNFGDILNNHTPNNFVGQSSTEQLTRPGAIPQREGGEAACQPHSRLLKLVPMARKQTWGGVAERGLPFSLLKKILEGRQW